MEAAEPGPQSVAHQVTVLALALGKGVSKSWLAVGGDSGGG